MKFFKNAHKFQKISYTGIIAFVYISKEEIHKIHEVSMGQNGKSKKRAKMAAI